ncbi:MAG: ParB/RepB/Spo0J family partition protein [Blastocatellia bacterium]
MTTRRALGRGLSALLSDSPPQGEELLEVDIDLIDPNPDQPRMRFPETKLDELAQSIRSNGLVQPILLRRVMNGRYQIVAGERRWRAAQRAGLHKVASVIRNIADDKLLELALIENIQRQELNPIEEALAYQRLIHSMGLTQDEVARQVGKDRTSIANYLRLLKLPAEIQRMLEEEMISMGHARALLGLGSKEEQKRLAEEIVNRKMSVRDVEQAVKKASGEPAIRDSSTATGNDANIRAAELKLKKFLETPVKIHFSRSGGRIEIEFASTSELDRIYSVIMRKSDP